MTTDDKLLDVIFPYRDAYSQQVRHLIQAHEDIAGLALPDDVEMHQVESTLDQDVYDAASLTARLMRIDLQTISRAVLFLAAAKVTPDPQRDPSTRPPLREYTGDRYRWRFDVPKEPYLAARERITAANKTVSALVEDGLREFGLKGKLQ